MTSVITKPHTETEKSENEQPAAAPRRERGRVLRALRSLATDSRYHVRNL